ncbi:conserved protein of unknown function [Nitrospira japonica]|uniref:Uncharacterized protein n=1 Tax=Nitrospira japonica TaxID=1325564 RepID=A0A1W1I5K0_9BACT|nr:conserved protein of unknown function [Nitrospira japonica]
MRIHAAHRWDSTGARARFYAESSVAASSEAVLPFAGMHSSYRLLSYALILLWAWPAPPAAAQSPSDFTATTEQSCSFGMAKGEASQHCQVPIPAGCLVARIPGTTKPWTTISKGGKMTCQFQEKQTDWKTKITGTCGRCGTEHCSVQFIVRFDCTPR